MSSPNILGEQPPAEQKKEFPWPIVIGTSAVVIVVALIAFLMYKPASSGPPQPPPYAAQLVLRDIKMATANNYVGGTVTYLEGTIQNNGERTVTGAIVEATFKNSLDQVVQTELLPVMFAQERPGYSDNVPLARAPLGPGKSAPFRITLEHVSSDWNGAYPAVRIVNVQTQ